MISWFVPQGSTFAADIDNLVLLIGIIVGVWFILAEAVLFGLIFKFRKRDGQPSRVTGKSGRDDRNEQRGAAYGHPQSPELGERAAACR